MDKYGTTVLFAVITAKNYILGQLGDGAILMCNNDSQYQLFSRLQKTSPTTRSMASSTAEFSLNTGVFSRDTFKILLLSTDGIYDVFSKNAYFLLYCQELIRQAEECKELLSPFTVRDPFQKEYIELSEEATDDCTIALAISARPCRQYTDILPQRYFPEKVSFSRAVNCAEFYETCADGIYYDIHVLDEGVFLADSKPDFYSCEILDPVDNGNLETGDGRSIFIYKRPAGFVSIQVLLDRYKHLEKRYELDDAEDEEKDIYTNNFWLNIYERLLMLNHEIATEGLSLRAFYPEMMFAGNSKILLASDAIDEKKHDTSANHTAVLSLKKCLDYFNIIGNLSCGATTLPMFGGKSRGQAVNIGGKPLCRVIYNPSKQIFGLWNISEHTWFVDGGSKKEIPSGKIMSLTGKDISFTAEGRKYSLTMYWRPQSSLNT